MPPTRFKLRRETLNLIKGEGKLVLAELYEFLDARTTLKPPRYKDKECGYTVGGSLQCQLHVDLNLWHYRLTRSSDPLLIYQWLPDYLNVVGLANHSDIFSGNGDKWCHEWHRFIDWENNEHERDALVQRFGPLP